MAARQIITKTDLKKGTQRANIAFINELVQLRENPDRTETSRIMYRKNELTGSYKTQAPTEMNFRTDCKT